MLSQDGYRGRCIKGRKKRHSDFEKSLAIAFELKMELWKMDWCEVRTSAGKMVDTVASGTLEESNQSYATFLSNIGVARLIRFKQTSREEKMK